MKTPTKKCIVCGSEFFNLRLNKEGQRIRKYTKVMWETAKFCSHNCRWEHQKGKPSNREGTGKQKHLFEKPCSICHKMFKRARRDDIQWEGAKFCSVECLIQSKIGVPNPTAKLTFEKAKQDHPEKFIPKKGKAHWNWKGGITPGLHKLRNSPEYITWRNEVYKRDRWTCQECKVKCSSKTIVAHHHKSFSSFPKLRYTVSNGITLCRSCHKKVHREIGEDTRFT